MLQMIQGYELFLSALAIVIAIAIFRTHILLFSVLMFVISLCMNLSGSEFRPDMAWICCFGLAVCIFLKFTFLKDYDLKYY